jgi:hypothetical protein
MPKPRGKTDKEELDLRSVLYQEEMADKDPYVYSTYKDYQKNMEEDRGRSPQSMKKEMPKEAPKGDLVKKNLKSLLKNENPARSRETDVDGVMREVFRGPASQGMAQGQGDIQDVDRIMAEVLKIPQAGGVQDPRVQAAGGAQLTEKEMMMLQQLLGQ